MNFQIDNREIGILTFWGVPNYGAFAQTYALNKIITRITPDNCHVNHIAYLHPRHKQLYFRQPKPVYQTLKSFTRPGQYRDYAKYLFGMKREWPEFERDYSIIPHTECFTPKKLEKKHFSCVVTGSDTIWDFQVKAFGDDAHLVGNRLNADRLVAYAPSFGSMTTGSHFPAFVKRGLCGYDRLSVRDENSQKIVEQFTGQIPPIALDPTLLWRFKEDDQIPETQLEDYILLYGLDIPAEWREPLQAYAKQHKLKIIGAGLAQPWCDEIYDRIGPLEWISLFKNAFAVITCTFHGLMFGLQYQKPIAFFQTEYVKNRSKSLLQMLGIDQLVNESISLPVKMLEYEWNYLDINTSLKKAREDSLTFLKKALMNE